MPLGWTGLAGKIADTLNDVIAANETLGIELARASRVVGKEGKLSQRVVLRGSDRVWSESIEAVNSLIEDLVRPTSEMQRVIGAVAGGDLSKKITADVHGEVLELKNTINAMVDQLNQFVSEVTRVVREVGHRGQARAGGGRDDRGGRRLEGPDRQRQRDGGQPHRPGPRHRRGDYGGGQRRLSKKISADVKGEFLELKEHGQRNGRSAQPVSPRK